MRLVGFCLYFCSVFAWASAVDLEKTMKDMGFQFKQAIQSETSQQLLPHLEQLITLTVQAKQASFPEDKAQQFQAGLTKVEAALVAAKDAATQDDFAAAQQHLRQVDALRQEYHKLRKVSIWQLLFG